MLLRLLPKYKKPRHRVFICSFLHLLLHLRLLLCVYSLHEVEIRNEADIIIGSESHLDQSFLSSEILPSNYTIFRKDRTLGGGGVFVGIKNYLTAIPYHTTSSNAEILWIKLITSKNHPTYVCSFYRPPNNDIDPLTHLRESLESLHSQESGSPVVLLGDDFNLPDISWNEGYGSVNANPAYGLETNNSLLDIVNDYHLEQFVHECTRGNHILDLLFCTHPTKISKVAVIPGISDHETIYFHFNLGSLSYKKASHNIYLYHKGNIEGIKRSIIDFQQTFLSSNPYANSVDQNWISFKNVVNQAVQDYIPQKQSRPPKHIPWLNKSIKTKMKKRKQQYNLAKKTKSLDAWESYRKLKNEIIKELEIAHDNYQNQLFTTNSNTTSKKFWRYIKSLRKDHVGVSALISNGKTLTDSLEKAEVLNNQFYSVFTDEDLVNTPQIDQLEYPTMPEISFNTPGIHKLLLDLDTNKSPGPDSIPAIILKNCADEISPILQVIFTQSMNSGVLPSDWLSANITPIYLQKE